MINSELSAIFYGLASAASWGAGDFSGGLATKRSSVYSVVMVSQLVGIIGLIILTLLFAESLSSTQDMIFGGLAGLAGGLGLLALYRGLAAGRMGIVAPVAAVVTAIVPIIIGFLLEGLAAPQQLIGFALALLAVWFISRAEGKITLRLPDLTLPVLAGLAFGLFFVIIDRVSEGAILWPLIAARIASISMILGVIWLTRQPGRPSPSQLPIIAAAGLLDTGGNAFFALATQAGRLDIAAMLSSLYPASTILLARFILQERLSGRQWGGVAIALVAVVLIAL